jgi:gliding motility-associated-like protein
MSMRSSWLVILFFTVSLFSFEAKGSHIVGGEFTYNYLGDTLIPVLGTPQVFNKYQLSLTIYEDCFNGQPGAILQDNPAYLGFYLIGDNNPIGGDTNLTYTTSVTVPTNFSNSCVSNIPQTCLLKKTFIREYYFAPSTTGYVISYQRCCRNNAIINVFDPGDHGSTYYCTLPPYPSVNNSAVFKNYPPQIICLNNPLYYDNSATDADGDSLSYEFCNSLNGANTNNIKPFPGYPDFSDSVQYLPPYSSQAPLTGYPPISIDPVTGMITGTPNRLGRYLVTVCCNEWRHGRLINTVKREFQFVVTNCSKAVIADIPEYSSDPNTYIVSCTDFTVNFVNTSIGGFAYHWNFGLDSNKADTSTAFEPAFTYPDTGTFPVKLVVNPRSTCPDSITRLVKIYPKFRSDFTDTGRLCPGAPVSFIDLSSATIKPVNYWKWIFGDGDSTNVQNPVHAYLSGGTYKVVLVSHNIKNCVDTAIQQVTIEDFRPFAGNDTMIVKGERVNFNATGGTDYLWFPPTNLSDSTISNPVGLYPDSGTFTYFVHIASEYGCSGYDTVTVSVVNQAEFFVPNAFSPNGDGRNDIFRPVAVGYRSLRFFRVFNRWGQEVYHTTSLESGWDGTFANKQCDIGTYYWDISFTDRFGKDGFLKGDVTLIR